MRQQLDDFTKIFNRVPKQYENNYKKLGTWFHDQKHKFIPNNPETYKLFATNQIVKQHLDLIISNKKIKKSNEI